MNAKDLDTKNRNRFDSLLPFVSFSSRIFFSTKKSGETEKRQREREERGKKRGEKKRKRKENKERREREEEEERETNGKKIKGMNEEEKIFKG